MTTRRYKGAIAAAVLVVLAGCDRPPSQQTDAPWCSAGAENGRPTVLEVDIPQGGAKPTLSKDNCRVRPGSELTWRPTGLLANTFEGVEFTHDTPDVDGRNTIPATPAGTQVTIRIRPVRGVTAFEYEIIAGGIKYDPEVIVDPR